MARVGKKNLSKLTACLLFVEGIRGVFRQIEIAENYAEGKYVERRSRAWLKSLSGRSSLAIGKQSYQ